MFRYQETFADNLTSRWLQGKNTYVRGTIRQLKNKAQAAYVAGLVVYNLMTTPQTSETDRLSMSAKFIRYMHPNKR